jgi:adenylate cyclase
MPVGYKLPAEGILFVTETAMTDPSAHLPRKLTTIFCADVQGYSTLVEQDEVGTVLRLKSCREAMVAGIERHHGRVINTWGDGLLAEFSSPVEAVFCAVDVQRQMQARNAEERAMAPMRFRIGINLGDVMVDGSDIYGEGVNVAARLESLAEPGGICISGTVFEQVRKKLDIGFDFIGTPEIKNIAEPVPAYRVLLDRPAANPRNHSADASAREPASQDTQETEAAIARWHRRAWRLGAILVVLIVINLITSPGTFWFVWPMLGMGLALALSFPFGRHSR